MCTNYLKFPTPALLHPHFLAPISASYYMINRHFFLQLQYREVGSFLSSNAWRNCNCLWFLKVYRLQIKKCHFLVVLKNDNFENVKIYSTRVDRLRHYNGKGIIPTCSLTEKKLSTYLCFNFMNVNVLGNRFLNVHNWLSWCNFSKRQKRLKVKNSNSLELKDLWLLNTI